ncbi:MAG TPA: metallophosphoesterase [Clostridia bacterium]|nr:metallophosphoesterase [Clostridia bacterium]
MNRFKYITRAYRQARRIGFDDSSKIILFSDCHRGDGSWADDFSGNQNLYFAALTYYYKNNYTYLEIGDGDELWKNKKISDIMSVHSDAFWQLDRFDQEGRLYLLYGNHDKVKKSSSASCGFYQYYDEQQKKKIVLMPKIRFNESVVLTHRVSQKQIFLLHGHQADGFNDDWWKLGRFLVRHVWKPLEMIGIKDPTSTAKNHQKKEAVEKWLEEWAERYQIITIAGHTHRPVFPQPGESLYFNDGCCVHPRCITGIEIAGGKIQLIKWSVRTKQDGTMYVGRDILEGPAVVDEYYNFRKDSRTDACRG